MAERHTELSSHLRRKSREPAPSNPPDLHEEENLVLAIAVAVGVSVALVVAVVTVLIIAARG